MMFNPLLEELSDDINHKVIPIPETPFSSHREIAKAIHNELPEQPCVILAESFSGRTAYELCRLKPEKIVHVVFAASFLGKPSALTQLAGFLPISLIKTQIIPNWILARYLFGAENPPVALFYEAISKVESSLLKNRLQIVNGMIAPEKRVDVPCSVVTALKDNLVNKSAAQSFECVFSHCHYHEINTGHFVLQAAPQESANIVSEVIKDLLKE